MFLKTLTETNTIKNSANRWKQTKQMNNTFSPEQISRRGNPNAYLILRQHELDLLARFMEFNSIYPIMKQKEIIKKLGYSSSTLQRYRNDKIMQRPYKSNDPKRPLKTSKSSKDANENDKPLSKNVKTKKNLRGGSADDVNPNKGRDLIKQVFSSAING